MSLLIEVSDQNNLIIHPEGSLKRVHDESKVLLSEIHSRHKKFGIAMFVLWIIFGLILILFTIFIIQMTWGYILVAVVGFSIFFSLLIPTTLYWRTSNKLCEELTKRVNHQDLNINLIDQTLDAMIQI